MNRLAVIALAAVTGSVLGALSLGRVAHAVTDTVFKYSAVRTGFFGISHMAMAPSSDDSAVNYAINPSTGLSATVSGGCFISGVNLPNGATTTQLAFVMASTAGSNPIVTLYRNSLEDGAADTIATKVFIDDSNERKRGQVAIPSNASAVVSNARYTYALFVCLGAGDTFFGARISYTFIHAGD